MSEFDAERALKEGAVTESGFNIEILAINADLRDGLKIVGIVKGDGNKYVATWKYNGEHPQLTSMNLKNKPRRVVKSKYLTSDIDAEYNSLICGDKIQTDACPYRLDITLEDGVPVSAEIVDLREKD